MFFEDDPQRVFVGFLRSLKFEFGPQRLELEDQKEDCFATTNSVELALQQIRAGLNRKARSVGTSISHEEKGRISYLNESRYN